MLSVHPDLDPQNAFDVSQVLLSQELGTCMHNLVQLS